MAKLRLIRLYLQSYFQTITARRSIDRQRVTFIDGFCGGGSYTDRGTSVSGTPLLLLEVVEEAQRVLNIGRAKHLEIDAQFYFVDSDRGAIDTLKSTLALQGHLNRLGRDIHIAHATFVDAYAEIKASISARTKRNVGRSVFVLDQKGYTDVPLSVIRDILASFSGAEVILTFAVGWLIDYLASGPQTIKRVGPLNLTEGQIQEYLRLRGERGGRLVIQRLLLQHLRSETGADFASPFFIRSSEANKDLWVVHLSRHVTARNVMVQSHWSTKNHSWHPGQGGLEILGFDPNLDPAATPDFWFGEEEERIMQEKLADDLIRRLRDRYDRPVNYLRFIADVANETPARMADFDAVASVLVKQRELRLWDEGGTVRRAVRPARRDLIEPHPQRHFHFMGEGPIPSD
ncbi:three-Cys-motif partner protein TcmP [Mesorhizobium sp. B1-1-9]|uniref:three-Cys-motif partner protein TcmP n=1 Tax=Mesorhizobium sp. B1-1-9 TaxID=2589975 RepID=UPI0015E48257|nr:three-Cys-motif partner protein TcmP [Mesorhizobium sp. B1-1-9]